MKGSKRRFLIFAVLLAVIILVALWLSKPFRALRSGAPSELSIELTSLEPTSPGLPNTPAILCYSFDAPYDAVTMRLDILRYENGVWQPVPDGGKFICREPLSAEYLSGDIRLLAYSNSKLEVQLTCGGMVVYSVGGGENAPMGVVSMKVPDAELTAPLESELPVALICIGDDSIDGAELELSDFSSYDDYGRFSCAYAVVLAFSEDELWSS